MSRLQYLYKFLTWNLKLYLLSDSIILNFTKIKARKDVVNLHYWKSNVYNKNVQFNLGDELSLIVVKYMLDIKGMDINQRTWTTKHLYAIGSIILLGYQNATVWGSGILHVDSGMDRWLHRYPMRKLDIRAVRGPYTRDRLIKLGYKCPAIYGDPAILMPLIYHPMVTKKYKYALIPHYTKYEQYNVKYGNQKDLIVISMITNDYKSVLDMICSAEIVISGSLHGIILSESYGVPTVFLRESDVKDDFKYADYYASTNRFEYRFARTVEEALMMQAEMLPTNIEEMQKGLMDVFPYDIWEK